MEMMRANRGVWANIPISGLWCSRNSANYIWALISLWHRKPEVRINVDCDNIYKNTYEETES